MKTLPALDTFTVAYLVACLWSSNDESTPQGGEPFDANYSVDDFAPEAIERAIADCARFQALAGEMILAGCERANEFSHQEMAGHDFWLTRCGHGSGFWDGDWPENGEKLTALCKQFGSLDPYLGDDGQIYFQ